jgi:hypothetical protein
MMRSIVAGVAGALLLSALPAFAQTSLHNAVPGPITGANGRATQDRAAPVPTPAGVPGARAEPTEVAPADRPAADMPPTEALFDSINRGDLAAAKEAINRGADIHGHNVLGLTPLELSVDLGRSNISFLLLSLRGGSGYSTTSGPAAPARPQTPAERRAAAQADQQERRREARAARAAAAPVAAPAPRTARLFAGDGGAPVPQAGFLGFDSVR